MTLALPTRRAALLAPPWAPPDLWRRAQAVPSLDLRFAERKDLIDVISGLSLITYTRAGSGTFVGSGGLVETAGTNVPRFDHDPITGECLGLLVEEQRTNSIRNNTMVGAVAGTPGTLPTNWGTTLSGLSRTVVGTGTESGIAYIDLRLFGTTTSTFVLIAPEAFSNIVASSGQTWTASFYVKLVAGSLANITSINSTVSGRDATNPLTTQTEATSTPFTLTSAALNTQRYSATRTLNNASTAFVTEFITILCSSGAAIDITLRIGLPQLELGAFATSVIPTTTAAVTRSADVASITGTNFSSWFNQEAITLRVEGQFVGGTSATFPRMAALTNASINSNEVSVAWTANSGIVRGAVTSDGVVTADLSTGLSKSAGSGFMAAITASAGGAQFASDGSLSTEDTSIIIPTCDRLLIAQPMRFQNAANTTIRRLTYWPQRLSSSTLQFITR